MINLIPKEEEKKMVRDFYYKLGILFLVVLSFSTLIVSVAILPSYFVSSVRNNIIEAKLETQKREPAPGPKEQTATVIKDINKKLDLIERAENNKFIVSQKVINAVLSKKMPDIKITDISFEHDSLKGKKISIEGNAPSREILLLFRRVLEDNNLFKQVNLPISNFVKGFDIRFSLTLIPS